MKSILLVSCIDQPGIIFSITEKILCCRGNIIHLEEHVDIEGKQFFMRVECEGELAGFTQEMSRIAERFAMQWELFQTERKMNLAIFVSRLDHCLIDTLIRVESGQLPVEVKTIISNHPDLKVIADRYGVRFDHFCIESSNKTGQEQRMVELLTTLNVDFLALARYMRIVGKELVSAFKDKIINVHHSFLPAFVGARPYHQAYERGVKIIGATSHFVTNQLDNGPIIEQAVRRVDHQYSIPELVDIGREIEKEVFFIALRKYVERKVIVYKNRSIVFQ